MTTRTDAKPIKRPSRRYRPRRPAFDHDAEIRTLRALWAEQSAAPAVGERPGASMAYVAEHFATDLVLRRRLRVLDRITPLLHGRVLEWGCQCAIDSCVYRMRLGDSVELHGADLFDADAYPVFHRFAGLSYRRMSDHVLIDYPNASFDVVTSNGVLEHVLEHVGTACEIGRIVRPGGLFIVECLPNARSYTEAIQRRLGHNAHERLYSKWSANHLMNGGGFDLVDSGYAFPLPTMLYGFPGWARRLYDRSGPVYWPLSDAIERLWPVNRLASNLWFVFQKRGGTPRDKTLRGGLEGRAPTR